MRVSRERAAENRKRVIETASRLFRENGFDGIGLKDLMAGAGLTQGGFYKQFASKDELVAVATRRALESVTERWSTAAAARPEDSLRAVCEFYLSPGHSAERADGCPIVALGSDAARQGPEVKAAFEAGMLGHLAMVTGCSARGAKTRRWSCCRRWSARFSVADRQRQEPGRALSGDGGRQRHGQEWPAPGDEADDRPERVQ